MKFFVWDDGRIFFCALAHSVEQARERCKAYYPGTVAHIGTFEPDVYDINDVVCFLVEQA